MHYNPINSADLNESESASQCCYSENTGGVAQTGSEGETKRENREIERKQADGTIIKLEEADEKIGEGGGAHCEWMGL